MSKTNDTSKLDRAKIENRVLADSELNEVSGGFLFGDNGNDLAFKANERPYDPSSLSVGLFGTSSGSVGF